MKKKILTLLSCLALTTCISMAQNTQLWGVTSYGGALSFGTIYKINPDGSGHTVMHSFDFTEGAMPKGSLFLASDGKLYGTCMEGGDYGSCTLYRFDPTTNTFEHLYDLNPFTEDADFPVSGFVELDGKLYAMAPVGGINLSGCIYSYDFYTETYSTEYSMVGTEGEFPYSKLSVVGNLLYGVCTTGGSYGTGTLFSYDPQNHIYTKLHDFNQATPYSELLLANDGMLYGMTETGGAYGDGTIYRYNPADSSFTVLHEFNSPSGSDPKGALMQASDGKLYGMTYSGGAGDAGVIFRIGLDGQNYTVLHEFNGPDGASPDGRLTELNGKLHGTTGTGGAKGAGVIFSYDLQTDIYHKQLDFHDSIGFAPSYGGFIAVDAPAGIWAAHGNAAPSILYPNPSKGLFSVNAESPVQVFDMQGHLLFTSLERTIDMQDYSCGMYLLQAGEQKQCFVIRR